jgi:hypothetical protein
VGSVSVQDSDGAKLELSRFVTPFRVGMSFTEDVTDLRPVLTGEKKVEIFIGTWVGPGHANGSGWLADVSFEFKGGVPPRKVRKVLPLLEPMWVEYGNASKPAQRMKTLQPAIGGSSGVIRAFITGHGQGNSENCAEFCPKTHTFTLEGKEWSRRIWRDNCAGTRTDGTQMGTYTYARAGWCPGARSDAWQAEYSQKIVAGQKLALQYQPENYINGNPGDNGSSHTVPQYYVSAAFIVLE